MKGVFTGTQGGSVSSTPPPVSPKKWILSQSSGGFDSGNGTVEIVKVTLFHVLFPICCGTESTHVVKEIPKVPCSFLKCLCRIQR